ncbi:N-acetyltransferase [Colwellia echini]|uniref:N-acetyltransferase n=1 Tax=Colwellia echini TaxID=1982103 RepID=A0ABY3N1G1_9GAMM|nr:N-acetyltransferase [Colwellia echini]
MLSSLAELNLNISFIDNINQINKLDWQQVNTSPCPFLQYDYFEALENSQSASAKQGWQAHHLVATTTNKVTAVMPMYLKSHSWGEYVFDWDWAEAFKRHKVDYYPKLVATVPFTPVTSNKLLSTELQLDKMFSPLIEHCQEENINSWHLLYCHQIETKLPKDVYERNTVQFHWFNRNYENFDHFLDNFTSRKRKNTRKERLSIAQQGLTVRRLMSDEITEQDLKFFYLTYQITYLRRGHQPHLNYQFFSQLVFNNHETNGNNILLIIANNSYEDVACSLFFYDDKQLYGRYWGCTEQYNNLHFELCYYQGIEFCIKNKLQRFNPGTQGEHKIQRGFEPVLTYSYHWIKHTPFREAVKNFCLEEQRSMLMYQQQCQKLLPFKQ